MPVAACRIVNSGTDPCNLSRMSNAVPAVLADLVPTPRILDSRWVRDITLVAGGALFTALAAQFVVHLGFTPVPLTGQTFAVLTVGSVLGSRRAAASQAVYWLLGMIGLPFLRGRHQWLDKGHRVELWLLHWFHRCCRPHWLHRRSSWRPKLRQLVRSNDPWHRSYLHLWCAVVGPLDQCASRHRRQERDFARREPVLGWRLAQDDARRSRGAVGLGSVQQQAFARQRLKWRRRRPSGAPRSQVRRAAQLHRSRAPDGPSWCR